MSLIASAFAATAASTAVSTAAAASSQALRSSPNLEGLPLSWVPYALLIGVYYFLIFRPGQLKAESHQQMIAALVPGDRVVAVGGILGTVTHMDSTGDHVVLETSSGVQVKFLKTSITEKLASAG